MQTKPHSLTGFKLQRDIVKKKKKASLVVPKILGNDKWLAKILKSKAEQVDKRIGRECSFWMPTLCHAS